MKNKLVLLSLVLFPWGTFSQAWGQCTCSDKETIAINQAFHKGGLAAARAALPNLRTPEVVNFAQASIREHEAIVKELDRIIIDAGLASKPSDISKAFSARAQEAVLTLKGLKGAQLEQEYLDFLINELGVLITAFETYFIPKVVTPTMKEWVAQELPKLDEQYAIAKSVRAKVVGGKKALVMESF